MSTRKGLKIWVSSVVCWSSACSGCVILCTIADLRLTTLMTVHDDNEYIPRHGTHRCEGLVCHGSSCMTCQRIFIYLGSILDSFGSDSRRWRWDGCKRGGLWVHPTLSFCEASWVCEECGFYVSFIVQC